VTDDLRARIAAALEECRVLTPDAQADAVMTVVQPVLDAGILEYLRTHHDEVVALVRREQQRLGRRNIYTSGVES